MIVGELAQRVDDLECILGALRREAFWHATSTERWGY